MTSCGSHQCRRLGRCSSSGKRFLLCAAAALLVLCMLSMVSSVESGEEVWKQPHQTVHAWALQRSKPHGNHTGCSSRQVLTLMCDVTATLLVTGSTGHDNPLHTVRNCGTSRIITVTCLMDPRARHIVDVVTTDADGERSPTCNMASEAWMNEQTYELAPGDNIYGVQACYVGGRLTGMTFSSAGGALVCGDPYDAAAECQSTVVAEQAPMSVLYAECRPGGGIERVTKVCFNANYVNPVISVTSE